MRRATPSLLLRILIRRLVDWRVWINDLRRARLPLLRLLLLLLLPLQLLEQLLWCLGGLRVAGVVGIRLLLLFGGGISRIIVGGVGVIFRLFGFWFHLLRRHILRLLKAIAGESLLRRWGRIGSGSRGGLWACFR